MLPQVFDGLSARVCEQAGFDVTFVSGFSVSAAQLAAAKVGALRLALGTVSEADVTYVKRRPRLRLGAA